ncbi:TraR/DksA family transcriptional regulator [bacterium]|nr:TraR/DksA family transcriptional regulator [bacterium]
MNKKKKEHFQKKLLEMREHILNKGFVNNVGIFSLEKDDLVDESDHAASIIQQGVQMNVHARDVFLLKEIDNALSKFEEDTFGLCEDTEEPIDEGRLEVQPWTRYTVEAAEAREKQAKRFARVS